MVFLRSSILPVLILILSACGLAQAPADNQTLFTISVAAPTKARDVQVRYFYTGESGSYEASIASPTDDNRIVIKTGVEGKSARTLRLVAFAPGCQLVTIAVDDLSSSRQGQLQCSELKTIQFDGKIDVSGLGRKSLKVQVLYSCDWCPQFFGMSAGALSPIAIGKTDVASDGSFLFDLPDFSADPLWSSVSSTASLSFYAIDAETGEPVAPLSPQGGLSKSGAFPVAASYPEVQFKMQPQGPGVPAH